MILYCHYYSPKLTHFTLMGALFGMLCATYIGLYYGVWDANMMRAADLPGDAAFRAELNVATQIQSSMLPCVFPAFPEYETFDIYASMNPAKEVGGDFYDFFLVDEDHLALVMADVSGKGVPAALLNF
ncbi:MAG: hypothetical protein OSJ59_08095 [Lachnospiraceae bacterium]|nr:hypothetical protein [Lachnospiraceae bacterium]